MVGFSFLKLLWHRHKGAVVLNVFVLTSVAFSTLLFPLLLRRFLDEGLSSGDHQSLSFHFLLLVFAGLLMGVTSALRVWSTNRLADRIVHQTRALLYHHLIHQGPTYYFHQPLGSIFPIIFDDMTRLKGLFSGSVPLMLRNALLFLGSLILMLMASLLFSAVIFSLILLTVLPVLVLIHLARRASRSAARGEEALVRHVRESLEMMEVVRAFSAQNAEWKRFVALAHTRLEVTGSHTFMRALSTAVTFFLSLSSIAVIIWLGGLSVMHQTLSSGSLIQFLISALIAATSLGALVESSADLQALNGISRRINALLVTPAVPVGSGVQIAQGEPELPHVVGDIIFENVAFSYPDGREVLRDFSLNISEKTTVGIAGPSGSGKSTLFGLMLGFHTPESGRIRIKGHLMQKDFHTFFAYVPQDAILFNRSILENIRYGRESATLDEVKHAAAMASIDTFIEQLPEGYNTLCGERGSLLSPGQRQRLAIARAILVDAPILLLDEITSGLDAESERAVMTTLQNIRRQKTIVMISHRLNTMSITDEVIFLRDGQIVLRGTHQDLLSYDNPYRKFVVLQDM